MLEANDILILLLLIHCSFRVVGGLLSAYDLSEDELFLEKARDIADRLLPAWNTPSGIPYNFINLARGNAHNPGWTGVSLYFVFSIEFVEVFKSFLTTFYLAFSCSMS